MGAQYVTSFVERLTEKLKLFRLIVSTMDQEVKLVWRARWSLGKALFLFVSHVHHCIILFTLTFVCRTAITLSLLSRACVTSLERIQIFIFRYRYNLGVMFTTRLTDTVCNVFSMVVNL
jgi:hypothetical protein